MHKYVVDEQESKRLKALENYQILDTESEITYDSITKLVSRICQKPIALITLLHENRQWFKSKVGIDLCETSREFAFCNFAIESDVLLEIPDTFKDSRFTANPFVTEPEPIRFYAGMPLISPEGFRLGTLCVLDTKPGLLTDLQRETLQVFSSEILVHMESAKRNRELRHLLDEEKEFHVLFNNSGDLHCITNELGQIEYINDSVKNIIGYSADELIGKTIWDFCIPGERDAVWIPIKERVENGECRFELETRVVTKSNEVRNYSWCNVLLNGRWLANGRDITEHKKSTQSLEQLSLVACHVNNGVVINDIDNHVIWVNKAFETITGYTENELLGKRLGDFLSGKKTDIKSIEYARTQTSDQKSYNIDVLSYRKDGEPRWFSVMNSIILNEKGEAINSIEIVTDVTNHKNAEIELQTLSLAASKSTVGILIRDKEDQVLWVNEAFEQTLGYTLAELKGKKIGSLLLGPETDMSLISKAVTAFDNRKPYEIDNLFYKKDGSKIWLYISNTPIFNSSGDLERQLCIGVNITERKKVEAELIHAREEAIKLAKAKETFLSVMSHEIRTPLNAIIGMTQILLEDKPQEHQIENLDVLKFSSENLLALINDVLDFNKLETGNVELESRSVDISKFISSTVETMYFRVNRNNVMLHYHIDPRIPQYVQADKTRLFQILINLLGNAIKFTEKGEIKVNLSLKCENDTTVTIKFEVTDTGIGISNDKLKYIFESYAQASSDTTRKYGGTGLGLAITRKLLHIHHSEIYVKSEKDKGSCFYFTIPFLRTDRSSEDIVELVIEKPLPSLVLVVDDNPINRMVVQKVLKRWEIVSEFAENGREALDMVQLKKYDLVLMDLHMPIMDGYEACLHIRALPEEKYKKLPIIALTASKLDISKKELTDKGMNDFVWKPFVPADLFTKIRPFLEKTN
ncbi:PAS domain S-box protein [Arcticibacter eurypsychrophilus]|uniref:PAS domain S-box protein n=1 Tax=Arcticibacter eurypsychrophilus TaxID=1434752 RepID=UPI00084DE876|nr:PAS domain S-box protein [Arcticibacter eurypsychrophilus]